MGIERVGLRRLYDSLGCSIKDVPEVQHSFPIMRDGEVSFYIGPKPPMGVMALEPSDQYFDPTSGKKAKVLQTIPDYTSDCFLEIAVSFAVSVDAQVSLGLVNQEENAKNLLLSEVEKRRPVFREVLDTICGLIGLRFHRQFILKQLIENPFIASGPVPIRSFFSDAIEMLQPIALNQFGLSSLRDYLDSLSKIEDKDWANVSRVFQWLLRAWKETDHIAKFLYLFIPLECVLGSLDTVDDEISKTVAALKNLVTTTGENDEKKNLLAFLDRIESKFAPTLNTRFEVLAQEKKIDGWEADIKAFRQFNRTRNLLLHAGIADVQSHLNIDQEVRTLEDLVERYVAVSVFGDPSVYVSRWRPLRGVVTKIEETQTLSTNKESSGQPNK